MSVTLRRLSGVVLVSLTLGIAACTPPPPRPLAPEFALPQLCPPQACPQLIDDFEPPPACPPVSALTPPTVTPAQPPVPPPLPPTPPLTAVDWPAVDGWGSDKPSEAFGAFLKGCAVIGKKAKWEGVCALAATVDGSDDAAVRAFFETNFTPHQVRNPDGSDKGLITGYYVPDLRGSRTPSPDYPYPLYAVPDDLLIVDLRSVYPALGDYRLRGRLVGRKVVPYWSRAEIDDGSAAELEKKVLFWVADAVELFFMQIQGSGQVVLPDGSKVMVHYADQNGHPFRSIGKLLLERGEMTRDQMSMQNIRKWALDHPEQTKALLAENPSYVFFSEMAGNPESPPGSLGAPLTPGRSIAVDSRVIPLGAPIFLSGVWPGGEGTLQRLVMAQDIGGAIRGAVRADFFWGMGDAAGELAGRMRHKGRMWVLLPNTNDNRGGESSPRSGG